MNVLIGEAPATADFAVPFTGRSGSSLAKYFGDEFMADVGLVAVNVCQRVQPRAKKGSQFNSKQMKIAIESTIAALLLVDRANEDRTFIMIAGKRLASAVGLTVKNYFERVRLPDKYVDLESYDVECCMIPHPSGVNTWWNDRRNRSLARQFAYRLKAEVING